MHKESHGSLTGPKGPDITLTGCLGKPSKGFLLFRALFAPLCSMPSWLQDTESLTIRKAMVENAKPSANTGKQEETRVLFLALGVCVAERGSSFGYLL